MKQFLKTELDVLKTQLKIIDTKTVLIFLSSILLFTISWYFSNPNFIDSVFTFHNSYNYEIGEFISYIYWFLFDTILFLIVPLVLIKIIFCEKFSNYGLNFSNYKIGLYIALFSIIIFSPVLYFVSSSETFLNYFPLMNSAVDDFRIFLIYEILFIIFIFSWEFIFRGFILFGLEKKFGIYAIFIQMLPFVILHNGKPFIETFASIFGALFLGYLALRTRSLIYGFIIHAAILISLDIIAYWTV